MNLFKQIKNLVELSKLETEVDPQTSELRVVQPEEKKPEKKLATIIETETINQFPHETSE